MWTALPSMRSSNVCSRDAAERITCGRRRAVVRSVAAPCATGQGEARAVARSSVQAAARACLPSPRTMTRVPPSPGTVTNTVTNTVTVAAPSTPPVLPVVSTPGAALFSGFTVPAVQRGRTVSFSLDVAGNNSTVVGRLLKPGASATATAAGTNSTGTTTVSATSTGGVGGQGRDQSGCLESCQGRPYAWASLESDSAPSIRPKSRRAMSP